MLAGWLKCVAYLQDFLDFQDSRAGALITQTNIHLLAGSVLPYNRSALHAKLSKLNGYK